MGVCPLCSAQVSDDFGLIECPGCSAPLLVHMDGRVEYSGAKESPAYETDDKTEVTKEQPEQDFTFGEAAAEIELPADGASEFEPPSHDKDLMQEAEFSAQEARYEEHDPTQISAAPQNEEFGRDFAEPPAQEQEQEQEPEPQASSDPFDIIPEEPAADVYRPDGPQDSADLSDIAKFGNSEQSSGRDGSLRYNLIISGIDTVDVRDAFREAITDRKLVWDIDQILRSLKNGEVLIPNVTPPKAYILITRLRSVPVQVRWEQYALSQT